MLKIDNSLVSEEIITKDFVCNLSACKGACCVEGEAGAPIDKEETKLLEKHYDAIAPFMNKKGRAAIEKQGKFIQVDDETFETPLVNNKECAYVVFDGKGVACCAVEQAYNAGVIDWKKPISCHLYPVRVQDYSEFSAVNYDRWSICSDACSLGRELKVPVYKFVKEALIRKFGKDWYDTLEKVALEHHGNE